MLELPATFALAPIRLNQEGLAVAAAARRGATAVLLYREEVPEIYSAVIPDGAAPVPCVAIRRANALQLAHVAREVELTVEIEPSEVLGVNVLVQVGTRGRPLLFLANYDTRPVTAGAYRNGSGVAALLELLARLQGWGGHQILVGFLDGEEMGGAGSRHCRDVLEATGFLGSLQGVVYVSGLGIRGLSVVPSRQPARLHLADLAVRCAADEGLLALTHPPGVGGMQVPWGIWNRPAILVTGPSLAVQYTALDQPDVLHPRYISAAVSVLERLARSS